MALKTMPPDKIVSQIGTDNYIRKIRELWIKYADPKYIDLLDVDYAKPKGEFDIDKLRVTL